MCGIAGVYVRDRSEHVELAQLRSMTDVISRRGPDDEGHFVDGELGIGMRRLSIIDVAGGHQPIANEDETLWIVYNGEIFNHEPLQEALKRRGHRFRTRSDTETVLHLFEEQGPGCLQHFRGMFALAIWDVRKRSLFIARDRLGIKPLHYAFDGRRLVFGSEIKAVLEHPSVSRALDWTGLDAFFTYGYIPAPWTAYRDVRQLAAGHYLIADEHGIREEQYWDLAMEPKHRGSAGDIAAEFVERFRDSVAMRMLSEVPLGAYLSGGVDSSLLVAMMAQAATQPVNTFTIGYGGETGNFLDERPFASEVSRRYKTNHREFEVLPQPEEAIEVALDAFDQPFSDDSLIPTHHICELARRHVTVALTGLGGDEAFAGYERYLGFRLSEHASRFPWRLLLRAAAPLVNALPEESGGHYRVNHLKRFVGASSLKPPARWQRYHAMFTADARRALYRPEIAAQIDFESVDRAGRRYYDRCTAADPLDRALYQDIKMYLPDDILALTDRVGMWHSLELRVPFIDHTLLEFCSRIPTNLKLRRGEKKYLLKEASRPFLPESVLNHRKQGFASPMAIWLRNGLRPFVDANLSEDSLNRGGVLHAQKVQELVKAHQERRSLNDKHLFALLMFQRWWNRSAQGTRIGTPRQPASAIARSHTSP
jgi:asparagine synthase (glutamine-hydrolysing)